MVSLLISAPTVFNLFPFFLTISGLVNQVLQKGCFTKVKKAHSGYRSDFMII